MLWTNVTVKLVSLQPWEHNPRTMTKRQAQRLLKSWRELGQFQTIAIGPHGEVYDGHQRLSALLAAYGAQYEIEARQCERELTEDERRYLITQANLPVGAWNFEDIAGWPEAQEWGFDADMLKTWNSDAAALATMLEAEQPQDADAEPQIDRAAELNEKWQVKRGDLWRIGAHRLLCGDAINADDVARLMQGDIADMVWTDPPYGVDYEGGAGNESKREKLEGDDSGDLYMPALKMYKSICAKNAPMYIWFASSVGKPVYDAVAAIGYEIRALIVWNKLDAHYGAFMAQYMQKHEPCLYIVNGNPKWIGPTNDVTVWDVKQPSKNEFHPTEKPLELALHAIKNHDAAIVADFFAGSGPALVASQNLNRECVAMEKKAPFCAVILERMATAFPGIEIERLP